MTLASTGRSRADDSHRLDRPDRPVVEVARLVRVPAQPTLEDLHESVAEMSRVQEAISALGGRLLVAVERSRRIAEALQDQVLATDSPRLRELDPGRAAGLARRAMLEETRNALHLGPRSAAGLLADAELLANRAPTTLAAVLTGELPERHARAFADEVSDLGPAEIAVVERDVLPGVLAGVGARSVPDFRRRVRQSRDLVHPVPLEVRHADAAARRGVWVDPAPDGMATLTALLTATAAHAICDRLTRTGQIAGAAGDPRTLPQLRADTLTDLLLDDGTLDRLTAAAIVPGSPNPQRPGPMSAGPVATGPEPSGSPVATSTVGPEDSRPSAGDPPFRPGETDSPGFLARLARSVRPRVQVTVPATTLLGGDAPATLEGHSPIDPETARNLAAHAPSFRRILTHPESGAVLSVGRDSYVVPSDLREWLCVRDVTCRFPGCGRAAVGCDVDHTVDWAEGGTTDAENLAHLCRAHHTLKHQTAWRVRHTGEGTLAWTSPAGHGYTTVPGNAVVRRIRSRPADQPDDDGGAVDPVGEQPGTYRDESPPF